MGLHQCSTASGADFSFRECVLICTACHESSVCHQDRSLHDQLMLDRSFGCQTHTSDNATSGQNTGHGLFNESRNFFQSSKGQEFSGPDHTSPSMFGEC